MFKKYLLIFLVILPFYNAKASLIITDVNKQVKFTDYGREITVDMKVKVELPKRNYYYQWSYLFNPQLKIEIEEAKAINRKFTTAFNKKKNELRFEFDQAFDGETLEFYFKYKQYNDETFENVQYMRREFVSIPYFMENANIELKIEVPDKWTIYSYHPHFIENPENVYTWKGIVPKNGILESFLITLKKAKWKVSMKNTIIGPTEFRDINVSTPLYFKGGNHIVDELKILTNKENAKITTNETEGIVNVEFKNLQSRLAQVNVVAIIRNGDNGYYWVKSLDPSQFSFVSLNDASILSGIISDIQSEENPYNIPEYIRIAQWVNKNIEYDESYLAKDMMIPNILNEKRGVCIHYSLLYEKMLRTVGIPATAVAGLSYNIEKGEFEQHSWVLVYINNEWVPIDPTWGIYSGKLPVSHIFTYKNTTNEVNYTIFDYKDVDKVTTNIREEVEFLE